MNTEYFKEDFLTAISNIWVKRNGVELAFIHGQYSRRRVTLKKRHIEFLLWDKEGLAIVDELVKIEREYEKAFEEANAVPFGKEEEYKEKSMNAFKIRDKSTPFLEKLDNMFFIDDVLDPYLNITMDHLNLPMGAKTFIETIKDERLRRHTRKRQAKVIKDKAIELGLWDESLVPEKVSKK